MTAETRTPPPGLPRQGTDRAGDSAGSVWTPESLKQVSAALEGSSPEEILRWGFDKFAPSIVLATGFGPEGIVLMHHVSVIRPETTVFYLDTDLLFAQTYVLRDELASRLGINFERVHTDVSLNEQSALHGEALWDRDPDACCHIRKVLPLQKYLSQHQAWITGIRRDQTPARANAGIAQWDRANKLVKLNPLAAWTSDQVWTYIEEHDLPYNPLHEFGYPSIGCWPCTKAVAEGDDPRSGRWAGKSKTECGIHVAPVVKS